MTGGRKHCVDWSEHMGRAERGGIYRGSVRANAGRSTHRFQSINALSPGWHECTRTCRASTLTSTRTRCTGTGARAYTSTRRRCADDSSSLGDRYACTSTRRRRADDSTPTRRRFACTSTRHRFACTSDCPGRAGASARHWPRLQAREAAQQGAGGPRGARCAGTQDSDARDHAHATTCRSECS